jgi:hypothetical protein
MPTIRPSACVRAARSVQRTFHSQPTTTTATTTRAFSSTPKQLASSHESQYDPPTGWLFGVKPGEKYKNEGWEPLFFYGFCGSLIVFAVAYAFKPDTS